LRAPGIKRHIGVDTNGLPHAIDVTTANVTDRAGAVVMFKVRKDQLTRAMKELRCYRRVALQCAVVTRKRLSKYGSRPQLSADWVAFKDQHEPVRSFQNSGSSMELKNPIG
jgi:hypothetical protein